MKISAHITLKEATKSQEAIRLGIDNTPNEQELENMKLLADRVFEPLRTYISMKRGKDTPIMINSFFRSKLVNEKIGGSMTSQHCLGQAMDIETNYDDFTNKDLFLSIKDKSAFDQLIWEFGDDKEPAWVHVSYKKEGNRKQILMAISENGTTKYIPFT
jgi:hypothetical protein